MFVCGENKTQLPTRQNACNVLVASHVPYYINCITKLVKMSSVLENQSMNNIGCVLFLVYMGDLVKGRVGGNVL